MNDTVEEGGLRPPKAIIFDWDNTLVDTWPTITHTMNVTLAAMGRPTWTEAEARERIARSLRDSFPDLFGDRWHAARDVFYAELERCHLDMLSPLPGAATVLRGFADAKLPMGVVSNKTGPYLRKEVAHLGWEGRFQTVFGAGDLARDKPAPDAVFAFLDRVGLAPGGDIWFVGDSPVDVEIAYAAGCGSVFVGDEAEQAFRPGRAPHATIGDCRGLTDLALRMDGTTRKH